MNGSHDENKTVVENKATVPPQVKVHPVVIWLSVLIVGFVLNKIWPLNLIEGHVGHYLGYSIIGVGMLFLWMTEREFIACKTSSSCKVSAESLITGGLFRYSRNPGYVTLVFMCIGIAFRLNNPWILFLIVPACYLLQRWVIIPEEHHLASRFGESYEMYRQSVRRWV